MKLKDYIIASIFTGKLAHIGFSIKALISISHALMLRKYLTIIA